MTGHRGTPATVNLARFVHGALSLFGTPDRIGEDARTGGAYFRVSYFGRRFTIRITEVDQ